MQKKYIVDGNLKDDIGYHITNDIILMEEEQAAPLVAIGRLKPAVEDITPPQVPAAAAPDGFPERNVNQPEAPNAPVAQPPTPPVNMQPQTPPKQPTQEQIAKDMEQLG